MDFYRPLVTLANRVDYTFYQRRVWGYHLSNLIFHGAACILLWLLILRLGFSAPAALLTASFFAVHPINVQDMLMVTGRCGLLGMAFSLLALVLLLRPAPWAALAAAGAYVCALLSKESAVMVPVIFLAAVWYLRAPWRPAAWRLGMLAGLTLLYLALRPAVGHLWPPGVPYSLWVTFITHAFPAVLWSYAKLVLAPIVLYANRADPPAALSGPVLFGAFLLFSVWLAWRARNNKERWPLFAWVWILAALLPPTVVMVAKSLMHDHWAYAALPGFLLPVALGLAKMFADPRPAWRRAAKGGAAVLLLFWGGLAHFQVRVRNTDQAFFAWSARFAALEKK